jgi:Recombinase
MIADIRAGVHRSPVRAGCPASEPARHTGVAARGGWPGRPQRPRASGAGAGRAVAAGGGAIPSPDDAAMTAQTIEQGRYMGGRPPYGYRLADAGPHPNQAHAAWGRRWRRLAPAPDTAPHVRWMFAARLAGYSVAGIARELNERGVPCPSAADQQRNRHRGGRGWNLRSVAVILANPRYTGHQVWSRRRSVPGAGRSTVVGEWAVSRALSHPGLVSEADFVAVQHRRAARKCEDGAARDYVLAGLVQCRSCGRRMDFALGQRSRRVPVPSWSPERPGPTVRRGAQHLCPRGRASGPAREATCVRSAPARRRRRAEDRRESRRLVAVRVEGDRLRQGQLDARPGRANASRRVDDQTGPDRHGVILCPRGELRTSPPRTQPAGARSSSACDSATCDAGATLDAYKAQS